MLSGFTLPEVLVALAVGGFLITALMLIQLQVARAGVRVQDLARVLIEGSFLSRQMTQCQFSTTQAAAVVVAKNGNRTETHYATRTDGTPTAGLSYQVVWPVKGDVPLAVVGSRCGLPKRCRFDVSSQRCLNDKVAP